MNKEENKCKWLNVEEGYVCMRSFSQGTVICPITIRYNRNNEINLPCDGAGYEEKNKVVKI